MAEPKKFERHILRCGLVLKSKEADVRLLGFDMPQLDNRYQVLTGKDLVECSDISFFGSSMPILAVDTISYVGQPILALFGPDYESVELMMSNIKPITEPLDTKPEIDSPYPPLEFSWGIEEKPEEEILNKLKKVETNFSFDHSVFFSALRYYVTVWQDGKNIHIQSPMQWPELVRSSVSKITGVNKKNIILHELHHASKHDEYLIMPAIIASIASIIASQTGSPVEIRTIGESARAGIKVKRTAYANEEGKLIYDNVQMNVDQGAYPFAFEEFQRQAMTGLLPYYAVKSFNARINIHKSNNYPASFCGSLGYCEALAATEYHTSRLSDLSSMTPAQMRDSIEKEKTRFTDYVPSYNIETHRNNTLKIADDSIFNRKWTANTFQRGEFGLVGFLRGIGFATGSSIAGFSTTMASECNFMAQITYTQNQNITLNSSALVGNVDTKYWRSLIESKFAKDEDFESVIFLEQAPETLDSGPDVLSRLTCKFTPQLAAAAKYLNTIKNTEKQPNIMRFEAENTISPCEFEYSGYGAMVTEIKVSRQDYMPVVRRIWAYFSLSVIIQERDVRERAKRAILNTLNECGAVIADDFELNLSFYTHPDGAESISSLPTLSNALTMASFANALYQVAGEEASSLPTSARKLQETIRGGKN